MTRVFDLLSLLAYDQIMERQLAVKTYNPRFTHDPSFKTRFTTEAHFLTSLEHDAIVPVYDYGIDGDWAYIVMRYMSGGSLKDRLEQGLLPPEESYRILQRIASALDMAHSHQVIHRDLKPQNILFDGDNQPYLTDFGMAKLAEETMSRQQTTVLGAPAYVSPELVRGHAKIDGRADVYALGCILFEMLTGQPPFQGETSTQIMAKHVRDPVPNVCILSPGLPPAMNDVFQIALAKEPRERFASASFLVSAFYQQIITRDTLVPVTSTEPTQPEPVSLLEQSLASKRTETAVNEPITTSPPREFFNRTNTFLFAAIVLLIAFITWGLYSLDFIGRVEQPESTLTVRSPNLPPSFTSENSVILIPDQTPTATTTPLPSSTVTPAPTAVPTKPVPPGRLVFVSNRDGVDSLYLISLSSPDYPEKLTGIDSSEFNDWWPSWCGNNMIVFERGRPPNENNINRTDQELRSIRTDVISYGQTFVLTTEPDRMPGVPSCSPDRTMVAYSQQTDDSGKFEVGWAIFDIGSGRTMSDFNLFGQQFANGGHVSWANDNRHVVLMSNVNSEKEHYNLYWVDKEGIDPPRQITPGFPINSTYHALAPDNNQLAYACVDTSQNVWRLCITSIQNPQPRTLVENLHPIPSDASLSFVKPSWSPDGEWLAYSSDKDGDWDIYLLHVSTNYEENLTTSWGNSDEKQPSWGP
jgi:serine/threonine protein kinase